jgi:CHASE3 domain sensor protein
MSIGKKIALSFALTLFSVTVIEALVYRNTEALIDDNRWVVHSHAVIESVETAYLALRRSISYTYEFVITGDQATLASYRSEQGSLTAAIEEFARLTADNPNQQRRVPMLRVQTATLFQVLDRLANERSSKGVEAAMQLVREGAAERGIQELRSSFHDMQSDEQRLLAERNKASEATARDSLSAIAF